ncbi:hypothetical protein [Mucilaginibacter antarcticus]|uniref:hypothetical protein n=1 Tax=Mucilaginibacter antarcticus TaxID=1855725 RepID=UPI00362A0BB0
MNKYKVLGIAVITVAAAIVTTSCNDKRSTGWEYAPNMYEHLAFDPDQKIRTSKMAKQLSYHRRVLHR